MTCQIFLNSLSLQTRKGQSAGYTLTPGTGWFFKGLPSGRSCGNFSRWRPPTVFAALSGVASFHRACLLAQDFTHEPACQTGERAPQGRFRHQPEQMVHPPFAWQLVSFPSLPAERRPRIAPCGTSSPYGHIPWKSRHSKPFLPSYQCIRNWSHL